MLCTAVLKVLMHITCPMFLFLDAASSIQLTVAVAGRRVSSLCQSYFGDLDSIVAKQPRLKVTIRPLVRVGKGSEFFDFVDLWCRFFVDKNIVCFHGFVACNLVVTVRHVPDITVFVSAFLDLFTARPADLLVKVQEERDIIDGLDI